MKCIVYRIIADFNEYVCHCVLMKYIVYGIMVDSNKYVCQHNIVY
jgi:hypothetical protein